MRVLTVEPLPGFDPEIGRWVWAMQEVRRRTVRLVEGLDQSALDWEGPEGQENAIGTLLYHIALAEMEWLFQDVMGLAWPDIPRRVRDDLPHPRNDDGGRLSRVVNAPLTEHVDRLARTRAVLIETLQPLSLEEWRRIRRSKDPSVEVTPEWAIFHLVEHEAGHAFQISSLKARATRFLMGT